MRNIVTTPIKVYQKWISPMFAPRCKYYPSCSSYAVTAIETYGLKGIAMSAWRLLRCNPWSHGGVDYAVKPLITLKTSEKTSVGVNK